MGKNLDVTQFTWPEYSNPLYSICDHILAGGGRGVSFIEDDLDTVKITFLVHSMVLWVLTNTYSCVCVITVGI